MTNEPTHTGYKEYTTDRTYMAKMGDWRLDKDEEIPLDGIGGVNIVVKADVHRSGEFSLSSPSFLSTAAHLAPVHRSLFLSSEKEASTSPKHSAHGSAIRRQLSLLRL